MKKSEVITIPIAHGEGNYYCDEATLQQLQRKQSNRVHICRNKSEW